MIHPTHMAALAALLTTGCTSVGARVHNLEELHTTNGIHRSSAALVGDVEWQWRNGIAGLLGRADLELEEKQTKKVDDPTETCLENLVELAGAKERSDWERSVKIQILALCDSR